MDAKRSLNHGFFRTLDWNEFRTSKRNSGSQHLFSREAATVFVYSYTEPIKLQSEFPTGRTLTSRALLFSPLIIMKQYQYELIFVDNV